MGTDEKCCKRGLYYRVAQGAEKKYAKKWGGPKIKDVELSGVFR